MSARNALAARGSEPGFHEQPGAGHWWNGERAPGADCVDWPEIFALFEASVRDEAPEAIEFTTVDPAVDSRHDWVRVLQPARYGEPARVRARWDAAPRRAVVETENVRQLWVEAPGGARPA